MPEPTRKDVPIYFLLFGVEGIDDRFNNVFIYFLYVTAERTILIDDGNSMPGGYPKDG